MKKNILLPTDFSDNAWSAVVYALKLYANVECHFYFLHSTKMILSTILDSSNKVVTAISNNAMQELIELKDMAQTSNANANHQFEVVLSSASLMNAIDNSVDKYKIDTVVMGTKGVTGAKELFFGSNTVRVVKKLKKCPVLIVPDEFDFIAPNQIAFPTDFNHYYGEELLPLRRLSELYNSKIRIVHINEEDKLTNLQSYNMTMLESYLKNYPSSLHWMPDYAKKTQEINDFIEELDINILVMINYKHSLIENIIKEPVIKKIGFHPMIPFFVIPCAF